MPGLLLSGRHLNYTAYQLRLHCGGSRCESALEHSPKIVPSYLLLQTMCRLQTMPSIVPMLRDTHNNISLRDHHIYGAWLMLQPAELVSRRSPTRIADAEEGP
jgi:hypothetical protein